MRSSDRITVGWVDGGKVDAEFAVSMLNLFRARQRIGTVIQVTGSLLSRSRNELVAVFLASDVEWLLMIDTDETISPEAFDKLVAAAHSKDRPIVAGVYFGALTHEPHPIPLPMIMAKNAVGRYDPIWDMPDDKVIPIDAAGTGCLLVHRSVFERIREVSAASPMGPHEAGVWCWFQDMAVAGEWMGEDIWFCKRAQDLGFPLVAVTGARLGHRKTYRVSDAQFREHIRTHPEVLTARHEVVYEGFSDD